MPTGRPSSVCPLTPAGWVALPAAAALQPLWVAPLYGTGCVQFAPIPAVCGLFGAAQLDFFLVLCGASAAQLFYCSFCALVTGR